MEYNPTILRKLKTMNHHQILEGLHAQREDGANTSCLKPLQRNPCNYNNDI